MKRKRPVWRGDFERRHQLFEEAMSAFAGHYNLNGNQFSNLHENLSFVPRGVQERERKVFAGVRIADDALMGDVIRDLKFIGVWGSVSSEKRREWAKAAGGRPSFAYAQLEQRYFLAIASAIGEATGRVRFPISRRANKVSGPAFVLLTAAMNRALFATSPGSDEGRATRIKRYRTELLRPLGVVSAR